MSEKWLVVIQVPCNCVVSVENNEDDAYSLAESFDEDDCIIVYPCDSESVYSQYP